MPKRTYLAARYDRRLEMIETVVPRLALVGLAVRATWLTGAHEQKVEIQRGFGDELPTAFLASCAAEDLRDIAIASVFVTFTEGPEVGRTSGGRHVELGYALARECRCIVIGPVENVFHHLEVIERHPDLDAFLSAETERLTEAWAEV